MIRLQGRTVCGGAASGTAYLYRRSTAPRTSESETDAAAELRRLTHAIEGTESELAAEAAQSSGTAAGDILEIHRMMLEDDDILDSLREGVTDLDLTAEKAVARTEAAFSRMFRETGDELLISRIEDIRDVCGRLLSRLSGEELPEAPREPFILVADELFPGDFLRLDCKNLVGIVTASGSANSHVSILIRARGIPAVICGRLPEICAGTRVLLNAETGSVVFAPDEETARAFRAEQQASAGNKPFLQVGALPCRLYVNIGSPKDVSGALLEKCDGIGLFRTEYLYFGRDDLPDEEEQYAVYKQILEKATGKPVVIRTFDIGSDKAAKALPLCKEENPALGTRGLRVYARYPEVFRTQVWALLRAAVHGDLRVMFPMVTSCREIADIDAMFTQAARELSDKNVPYRMPLRGAMIETPAAALLSEQLAEKVDFFSVGTNDLTQYTLAIDRQNGSLDRFDDRSCEAVLALIRMTVKNAHSRGIPVGICGELAADRNLTQTWISLGIDSLSVSPSLL